MKITSFTEKNPKFNLFKIPQEDSFKFCSDRKKVLLSVADGITRDPKKIKKLPRIIDIREVKQVAKNYPHPSPAKIAADLFCNSFIEYLKNKKIDEKIINDAARFSNKKIKKLNKKNNPCPDYLENDFWSCVASFGAIQNNILYYGFVADCGLAVFDSKGKIKFRTNNEVPRLLNRKIKIKFKTSFRFPRGRKIIRSRYRNNPSNSLSYGAFTGEERALDFVRTGKVKMNKGDYAVFYSDGAIPFIKSGVKADSLKEIISKNRRRIAGGEATVIAVKI